MRFLPLIQEIIREAERAGQVKLILGILQHRFGPVGPTIERALSQVEEQENRVRLARLAATCGSLLTFEGALCKDLPRSATISRYGKRSYPGLFLRGATGRP